MDESVKVAGALLQLVRSDHLAKVDHDHGIQAVGEVSGATTVVCG